MSDTTNRLAGIAYLSVDGVTYLLRGEFAYRTGKRNRTSIEGQDQIHGYGEKPVPGQMKGKLTDTGGTTVAAINDMTNVTVVCELANGKTIIGRNMWTVDDQTVDTVEASYDVVWEGLDGSVTEN